MLLLPSVLFYQDEEDAGFEAVVYADDTEPDVFYAIPAIPRIKVDREGLPVFKLIKYDFDNDVLAENEGMQAGGGYIQMDIALGIPPHVKERLVQTLSALVPAPQDPNEPPPIPRLAMPQYTEGKVRFFSVTDPQLIGPGFDAGDPEEPTNTGEAVRGVLAEGNPSLIGSNVAGLNVTLTPMGATFFEKTMVGENGQPVDGLLPIRVEYDLTFMARLPPIKAFVHAEKSRFHADFESIRHDFEGRGCNEDYRKTTHLHWETLRSSEAVQMEFDTGTLESDDPAVVEMRTFVMSRVAQWTQDAIMEPVPENDPSFPDIEDIYKSSDDVYRFRAEVNNQSADLLIDILQRSIGEKRLHPNASLRPAFGDLTPDQMSRFVQHIDLTDEFFQKVEVEPIARVAWEDNTIAKVSLIIAYNGEEFEFDYTKPPEGEDAQDERGRCVFDRVDGNRDYTYRYIVQYLDPAAEDFESDVVSSRVRELDVFPRERGYASVPIEIPAFNESIENVTVELEYRSVGGSEFRFAKSYDGAVTETWKVPITGAVDGEVTGVAKWRLPDGFEIEESLEVGDDLKVIVTQPALPKIQCMVIIPESDSISNVFVTMKPDLPDAIEVVHQRSLGAEGTSTTTMFQKTFTVPPNAPRRWRYRYTIDPKGSAAPAQSGPSTLSGNWSEPIDSGEVPEINWDSSLAESEKTITISKARLTGSGLIAAAIVLTHERPGGETLRFDHTFQFTGTDVQDSKWTLTLPNTEWSDFAFDWAVDYFHETASDTRATGTATALFFAVPAPE